MDGGAFKVGDIVANTLDGKRAKILGFRMAMSRNIPQVRRWLVNYWRDGKVIASDKVMAPTRLLAILALRDVGSEHWQRQPTTHDRTTITPMRKGA